MQLLVKLRLPLLPLHLIVHAVLEKVVCMAIALELSLFFYQIVGGLSVSVGFLLFPGLEVF